MLGQKNSMTLIYKIAHAIEWEAAKRASQYKGSSDDLRDGFIHFSTSEQLEATFTKYFKNKKGLILICVESEKLDEDLKWEPSRGGDLFPHLYAPLPTNLILWEKQINNDEVPNP